MTLIGHQTQWAHLSADVKNQRLPPAYLFYGLSGIGKSLVATAFAQELMCPREQVGQIDLFGTKELVHEEIYACSCSTCERIAKKNHPDFFWLETDKQWLRIDEVRELQQHLALTLAEASHRVVVVNDADKLTRQASNALLKTIEEPPPKTLFIFIAPNLFQILPTIRSRCRYLYFSAPLFNEAIRTRLRLATDVPDELIAEVYQIAEGSIGLSLRLLCESGLLEVLEDIRQFIQRKKISFQEINRLVDTWVKQELDLVFLLEIMKKKIFQRQRAQNNFSELEKITRLSQAQVGLKRNLNKTLLLENLLLELVA